MRPGLNSNGDRQHREGTHLVAVEVLPMTMVTTTMSPVSVFRFAATVCSVLTLMSVLAACNDAKTSSSPSSLLDVADVATATGLTDAAGEGVPLPGADAVVSCPGSAGCPCVENAECNSSLCIDDPHVDGGKACARQCVDSCPDGYKCANVSAIGTDVMSICVPKWGRICDPCSASVQCDSVGMSGLVCVDQGGQGMYCGAPCGQTADCPTGYTCKNVLTAEGGKALQCVLLPDGGGHEVGLCACSTRAIKNKLATSCAAPVSGSAGSPGGSCKGTRTCTALAMGDCAAPPPKPETCNGLDDDCNGLTDEGSCSDSNDCTVDTCDEKGLCQHKAIDASACNADGSVCTESDTCQQGVCMPGKPKNCDDKNICTKDQCDSQTGCVHLPDNGAPCEDDNPCTLGDVCAAGQCQPGVAKNCKSPDGCTAATCSLVTGKCAYATVADGTLCDDGVVCTGKDTCNLGVCAGQPMVCDDKNPCTVDGCDIIKGCTALPQEKGTCDDGNACTAGDQCKAGQCLGTPMNCDDKNTCTLDACSQGSCTHAAKTGSCDDEDACTVGDVCALGSCQPGKMLCTCKKDSDCPDDGNQCNGTPFCDYGIAPWGCKTKPGTVLTCDDGNPCTFDICNPSTGCTHGNNSSSCDDGNNCTVSDTCSGGKCLPGKNACECTKNIDCAQLEDGNACNGTLVCNTSSLPYKCVVNPATVVTCPSTKGTCSAGTCSPATGACTYTPQNNGQACNADDNLCTGGDACNGGVCVPGAVIDCNDSNVCTNDACSPAAGCTHLAVASACSDGNACTSGDACTGGVCTGGAAKNCNDNNPCTTDSCNPATGACVNTAGAAACDDGNACTSGDKCVNGSCSGLPLNPVTACDDGKACTADSCDPTLGCQHATIQAGQSCGSSKVCTDVGTCITVPAGMALIPAAAFWMGCNSAKDSNCDSGESPQHKVTLSAFYMDLTEVTAGQWQACANAGGCKPMDQCSIYANWPSADSPATCMTAYKAQAFCKWRGAGYDLPTEAQWEMAARGSCEKNGSTNGDPNCKSAMRTYPWGEAKATCTYAWMNEKGGGYTGGCGQDAPWTVGAIPAGDSPYGLHDMAGNVSEWTRSASSVYANVDQVDPNATSGDILSPKVVLRGASYGYTAPQLRASARVFANPALGYLSQGFRCIKTYP